MLLLVLLVLVVRLLLFNSIASVSGVVNAIGIVIVGVGDIIIVIVIVIVSVSVIVTFMCIVIVNVSYVVSVGVIAIVCLFNYSVGVKNIVSCVGIVIVGLYCSVASVIVSVIDF